MAITYIKLGPIGDLFNSDELGIYLTKTNSSEVDLSVLKNRLKAFYLTGFLVEISKVEHDNIKLKNNSARNIPLVVIPVSPTVTLEPVEKVLNEPPLLISKGNRFLVARPGVGPWLGYEDYIAEFDGNTWIFTKPQNGYSLPVYNWGISLKYTGTYPSGIWSYDESQLLKLSEQQPPGNSSGDEYALQLFLLEKSEREKGDEYLEQLINNIVNNTDIVKAVQVSIDDTDGYYDSNNVESALQEIARKVGTNSTDIQNIYRILSDINYTESLTQRVEALETTMADQINLRDEQILELNNKIDALGRRKIPIPVTGDLTIYWKTDIIVGFDMTYQDYFGPYVNDIGGAYLEGSKYISYKPNFDYEVDGEGELEILNITQVFPGFITIL